MGDLREELADRTASLEDLKDKLEVSDCSHKNSNVETRYTGSLHRTEGSEPVSEAGRRLWRDNFSL